MKIKLLSILLFLFLYAGGGVVHGDTHNFQLEGRFDTEFFRGTEWGSIPLGSPLLNIKYFNN